MKALISQKENIDSHGTHLDALEQEYVTYFESLGIDIWPLSNFKTDIEKIFEEDSWDFVILTGGGSVPNEFYIPQGNEPQQANRDIVERKMVEECIKRKIPILAICRGMQFLNGIMGGKVAHLTDLNVARPIAQDHPVFCNILDKYIMVNNYHNDGIKKEDLAEVFQVLAEDEKNKIVEGFYSDELMIYALQWHPERKFATQDAKDSSRRIVENFINKYISEGE